MSSHLFYIPLQPNQNHSLCHTNIITAMSAVNTNTIITTITTITSMEDTASCGSSLQR